MTISPYEGISVEKWEETTQELLEEFPVKMTDLAEVVRDSWKDIFVSKIGKREYRIGREIVPEPQIMGFLLHELIPLNLESRFPRQWKKGRSAQCDAFYLPDDHYSFEIKTSSSTSGIFGNRSYAHISSDAAKRRGGYFLAVNFAKFSATETEPSLTLIRFGWLDASDWIGQRAESGQQAHLTKEAKAYKLRIIWPES